MARAGIDWDQGPVRVLTMPRVLGFAFNPISVWYIHHRSGALAVVLYEVNNTFGERHEYLLPVDGTAAPGRAIRQSIPKAFHVSPFMGMDMRYDFRVSPPGAHRQRRGRAADRCSPHRQTSHADRCRIGPRVRNAPAVDGESRRRNPVGSGQAVDQARAGSRSPCATDRKPEHPTMIHPPRPTGDDSCT
jgi:hypothetical protein